MVSAGNSGAEQGERLAPRRVGHALYGSQGWDSHCLPRPLCSGEQRLVLEATHTVGLILVGRTLGEAGAPVCAQVENSSCVVCSAKPEVDCTVSRLLHAARTFRLSAPASLRHLRHLHTGWEASLLSYLFLILLIEITLI